MKQNQQDNKQREILSFIVPMSTAQCLELIGKSQLVNLKASIEGCHREKFKIPGHVIYYT